MADNPFSTPGFETTPTVTASNSTGILVLIGGACTTVLALVGVYFANKAEWNVMGWYADYVIPIGALLVGGIASSGYGITSWMTGTKITGRLLFATIVMLTGGYVLAQYLEFRIQFPEGAALNDGTPLSFLGYYDLVTRSINFEDHGKPGSALGLLGYGVRALEAIGFVGGGVLVPAVLWDYPYCEACQRYKRTKDVAFMAASLAPKKVSKKDVAAVQARAQEEQAASQQAAEGIEAVLTAARAGDGAAIAQEFSKRSSDDAKSTRSKIPARILFSVVHCQRCFDGELRVTRLVKQGNNWTRSVLNKTPLPPAVVAQLVSSR